MLINQSIYSQKKIVGKVEFYKSNNLNDRIFQSTTDVELEKINSNNHSIKVIQGKVVDSTKTDDNGIFKFNFNVSNMLDIVVNENSTVLEGRFHFKPNVIIENDTLLLKISDKKIAVYKDSISAKGFYSKYNEKKALEHFKQGKRQLLAIGGEMSKLKRKEQQKLTKNHDVKFNYVLFGSLMSRAKLRILERYNSKMKELLGIKNVW